MGNSGLVISALNSRSSGSGSSPVRGHCVLFLHFTLKSASFHLGVYMATGESNAWGNPAMDQHPIHGGVEILLVLYATEPGCKRWSDGPHGSYADLTIHT